MIFTLNSTGIQVRNLRFFQSWNTTSLNLWSNNLHSKTHMKTSIELLNNFVRERLGDDVGNLADYDMEQLKGDKNYGCPGRRFEYDNSNLVRALFVVLWHGVLPELNSDTIGDGKEFRGDTIHTSGALLGHWDDKTGLFDGLNKRYEVEPEEMKEDIKNWPVSRIGNMLLLPSQSLTTVSATGKEGHVTINTFRGFQSGWHDYFDRFLIGLKDALDNGIPKTSTDEISLPNLMSLPCNRSYFKHFDDSFDIWLDSMMLNDCLEENGSKIYRTFIGLDFKDYPYHSRYRSQKAIDNDRKEYKSRVREYLETTGRLIRRRSEKMVKRLKELHIGEK